jgi:type I restriction enzyme S subunit
MKDLCEITSSKRIFAADYQPEGIPFYRGKEITEKHKGNLDVSTELFIDPEKFAAIRAKFGAPVAGDLLLTSVGTLGSPYVVRAGEEFYFKDGNLTWFRKLKGLDSRYLYYWLLSPLGRSELKKCTIGSSQSAYTIVLLKDMEIDVPDLPTQRKIAGILSAYDDLIENNLRRIKILEEMAQSLYREWFVHFRFPGHEADPLVDSSLGPIPKGWAVRRLDDISENFDRKRKPISKSKRAERQGIHPYYGAAKIFDYLDDYIFDGEYLLMAEDGSVITPDQKPVLQLATGKFWANNHTHILRGTTVSTHFLYLALLEVNVSGYITGAAQPKITQANMNRIPFVCGPASLHERFDCLVEPLVRMWQTLDRRNENLRRTRDLLLPKLLQSG